MNIRLETPADYREMGVGFLCMEGNIGLYKHACFGLASRLGIHYHDMPRDEKMKKQWGCTRPLDDKPYLRLEIKR